MYFRILIVLIVLVLSFEKTFSQVEFGVIAGGSFVNNVEISNDSDQDRFRLGYHFGLYSSIDINEHFSISPELIFSNKGKKIEPQDISLHLNYIGLPILVDYKINKQFRVKLGPEISYLLSAKYRQNGHSLGEDDGDLWNQKIDLGIATGVKFQVINNIGVELRYVHGLISVVDVDKLKFGDPLAPISILGNEEDLSYQNRVIQLSLSYSFR